MPGQGHAAKLRIQNTTLYSLAADKECRLSGDLLGEIILGNRHAKKETFWSLFKRGIKNGSADNQDVECILKRFYTPDAC